MFQMHEMRSFFFYFFFTPLKPAEARQSFAYSPFPLFFFFFFLDASFDGLFPPFCRRALLLMFKKTFYLSFFFSLPLPDNHACVPYFSPFQLALSMIPGAKEVRIRPAREPFF